VDDPTESAPTESAPTESAPTESAPTESAPNVIAAFAAFVRQRLADVTAPLAPLLGRRDEAAPPARRDAIEPAGRRSIAMVIVAAAAPFAPTAHARARLLRQAHASGVLSARETEDALGELRAIGAPRS
jgi:hypothetical protein